MGPLRNVLGFVSFASRPFILIRLTSDEAAREERESREIR